MVLSKDIVKLTSETLSQWAAEYALDLRRNSTKSAKIRALCQLPAVAAACTPAELKALDDLLNYMDEKRRKRSKASEADNQEDDEARKENNLRLNLGIHLLSAPGRSPGRGGG